MSELRWMPQERAISNPVLRQTEGVSEKDQIICKRSGTCQTSEFMRPLLADRRFSSGGSSYRGRLCVRLQAHVGQSGQRHTRRPDVGG